MLEGAGRGKVENIRRNILNYRKQVYLKDGSIRINHDQTRNQVFTRQELLQLSPKQLQE